MPNSIKILVCYHKPAKLYKDDIYVPIHLGRALATQASKDGKISQDDYQWMLDNMIGDDTGDNISHLNRYFCELTAIYWAWKNYDKLGNPDYIGFCHYRRLFDMADIKNATDYDITTPVEQVYDGDNIEQQFNNVHHINDLAQAIEMLGDRFANTAKAYLRQKKGYYYNMFIMRRNIFFEYCDMLFKVLMPLHNKTDYDKYTPYNQRMPGMVAERLTGIFISEKEKTHRVNKVSVINKDIAVDTPVAPMFKDAVCVCLSSDNNYAKQLGVTIASIKANRKKSDNYDICVLDGGISELNKKRIKQIADKKFSIRFINISGFMDNIDTQIFSLNAHFTIATYFRFFIPQIFSKYRRMLYMDCDLVVNHDLSDLYNSDLGEFAIGAVRDVEITRRLKTDPFYGGDIEGYLTNTLNMKNPWTYFQAGVLLLDIKKLQEMDFTQRCIDRLKQIKKTLYVDQCILNSLLDGRYKQIDSKWNVMWQLPIFVPDLDRQLDVQSYNTYMASRANPYIVHYAGSKKPWKMPELELAEIWWKYARQTPFYEEILFKSIKRECYVKNTQSNINNNYSQFQYHHKLERIFSVKGLYTPNKSYKVLTIFGIKIKFRKDIRFIEYILSVRNENQYKILRILGFKIKFKRKNK